MKKIGMVLIAAFALCTAVQAAGLPMKIGSTATNLNPLDIARAFVMKPVAYYKCELYGNMLIGGSFQWTSESFVMDKSFAITNLVVNWTNNIALPEPIYGIPLGDGGVMQDVFLNVTAWTASGDYAGGGYTNVLALVKGGDLVVTLVPAPIAQEIPGDFSQYGNDISLEITGLSDYGYGYGVQNGKLVVWLPPVGGTYDYIVRQASTRIVLATGQVTAYRDTEISNDVYVGVKYLGNVVGADFPTVAGDRWVSVASISFDCSVPVTTGTNMMGKVVFTDVGSGNLEIIIFGDYQVFVQKATDENGDMPFLPLENRSISYDPGWKETRVNTTGGNVGKVVITIIPNATNNVKNPWLNLHRFYGTVGGGGKG
jgi:hypothetical protein